MQIGIVKHRQNGHCGKDHTIVTVCRLDRGRQNFQVMMRPVTYRYTLRVTPGIPILTR